ncbi:unnamed protein product, partial [Staurois parvus]
CPIIGVSGRNSVPIIGVSGRNKCPHHWCQPIVPNIGVSGGRNSAPSHYQ